MKKKNDSKNDLVAKLERFADSLGLTADEASRADAVRKVDAVIEGLSKLRQALIAEDLINKAAAVRPAIAQVVEFLESAKHDERLTALLVSIKSGEKPPKRKPIEIPAELSNEQIRELLQQELSSRELQAIAAQRAISVHAANRNEIKQAILGNLNREEGYQRLASST
ncbi:MAG: hypothetical protein JO295_02865 [Verrucomicrobia bacterium]|nr:hypothetical protein [Verrucomicrobiota bacterium]